MASLEKIIGRMSAYPKKKMANAVRAVFDQPRYLRLNPDVAASGADPIEHYLKAGWREGRSPHALFDGDWYLRMHLDVAASDVNPLIHYLGAGAAEGRDPHPLFDQDYYREHAGDFDAGATADLVHYVTHGEANGVSPHPFFDLTWYAETHRSGERSGAFSHYLDHGESAGEQPHPLFDPTYYQLQRPDLEGVPIGRLYHFAIAGEQEGAAPHPLFDTSFYLEAYPDIAEAGAGALRHFLTNGYQEGRRPNAHFDTSWYQDRYGGDALTDPNPLVDYVCAGAAQNRAPFPEFPENVAGEGGRTPLEIFRENEAASPGPESEPESELADDAADDEPVVDMNPPTIETAFISDGFVLIAGWSEEASTIWRWALADTEKTEDVTENVAIYVRDDVNATLELSGEARTGFCVIAPAALNPHDGLTLQLDDAFFQIAPAPAPVDHIYFEMIKLAAQALAASGITNNDVAAMRRVLADARRRFLSVNGKKGLLKRSSGEIGLTIEDLRALNDEFLQLNLPATLQRHDADYVKPTRHYEIPPLGDAERDILADAIDPKFYLAQLPIDEAAPADLLAHYLDIGFHQGLRPSKDFDPEFYLERNPDIDDAGVHPFVHYVLNGQKEGRMGAHPLGQLADHLASLKTREEECDIWNEAPDDTDRTGATAERLRLQLAGVSDVVVAFSHDNYTNVVGGLQNCVRIDEEMLNERNIEFLQISPGRPLPKIAEAEAPERFRMHVVFNGEDIGCVRAHELAEVIHEYRGFVRGMIVHSLLGFDLNALSIAMDGATGIDRFYWVHDYSSICPGYNLLRNGYDYCGAPGSDTAACRICVYGDTRRRLEAQVREFFEEQHFHVIAPSEAAAEIWREKSGLPAKTVSVQPHTAFEENAVIKHSPRRTGAAGGADPVRLAFLGYPSRAKGWTIFKEIVREFHDDDRYRFYHLGAHPGGIAAEFVPVSVSKDDPRAMINAILDNRIDIALILSVWPETYCLTAHEAIAGGAGLIGHVDGGNIPRLIDTRDCGFVVENIDHFCRLLGGDAITRFAEEARKRGRQISKMHYSGMTSGFITSSLEAVPAAEISRSA